MQISANIALRSRIRLAAGRPLLSWAWGCILGWHEDFVPTSGAGFA
jgi:hypothetical protein